MSQTHMLPIYTLHLPIYAHEDATKTPIYARIPQTVMCKPTLEEINQLVWCHLETLIDFFFCYKQCDSRVHPMITRNWLHQRTAVLTHASILFTQPWIAIASVAPSNNYCFVGGRKRETGSGEGCVSGMRAGLVSYTFLKRRLTPSDPQRTCRVCVFVHFMHKGGLP